MDYYFLVLWTELCYHIWLNHAISVSCNSVLLHTRLSIYNNIYINHSHLTCLYYVYMYIASCYINCLLFLIRLVNTATYYFSDSKVLGILWNSQKYYVYIDISIPDESVITRRYILSVVASIFDSLGLILTYHCHGKDDISENHQAKVILGRSSTR